MSIQQEELRRGNYISLTDIGKVEVLGVLPDKIYYTPSKDRRLHDFLYSLYVYASPIEITETILLRFGFRKNEVFEIYHNELFTLWYHGNKIGYQNTEIKYVHQLQNLYFALTGKELIDNN